MGVIVRRETSADVAAARAVHVAAFAKHGVSDEPVEARLLDALRDCDGWLAELTIVAEAPEPSWGNHFQVRTLTAYRSDIRGRFRYATPFDDL